MLAGGRSSRMGRDKALMEVGGAPMAATAAAALRDAGADDIFAVGGDATGLEALGLRTVPDRWPGQGPLGGLVTALTSARHDVVVVLACDLPAVTAEAVDAVVVALGDADAAIPVVGGRSQQLLAAWRASTALVPLETAFLAGERAVWRASRDLEVATVTLRVASWAGDLDRPDNADA